MIKDISEIINNPKFKEFQKYIDILAETGEFSIALVDIEREIVDSLQDGEISNQEMQIIGIKSFNIIKMLYDRNFKFKKLDSKNSEKLKDLLKNDLENVLLFLISKIINKIRDKYPALDIECDIELIVKTIVNTAELTLNISKKSAFYKYVCCCIDE